MSSGHTLLVQRAPGEAELAAIARILHEETGIVIAPGKTSMVQSRLGKRLRALGLSDYQSYIAHVSSEGGVEERRQMISALTTNVTHFFRENHHFETLRDKVLPPLLVKARSGGRVRLWSAGCSNGQEAYSIAMTIAELAPDFSKFDIRILASDIDPVMVEMGAQGIYREEVADNIPAALREKYISPCEEGVRITAPLRGLVQFRELNLHDPWPMRGAFDVIFCRNVVIYFDADAQSRLWARFEAQIAPGGWLFVGHSERVGGNKGSKLTPAGVTTYRKSETNGD